MTVTMLREWTFSEYFIPLLFDGRRHEMPATEGSYIQRPIRRRGSRLNGGGRHPSLFRRRPMSVRSRLAVVDEQVKISRTIQPIRGTRMINIHHPLRPVS